MKILLTFISLILFANLAAQNKNSTNINDNNVNSKNTSTQEITPIVNDSIPDLIPSKVDGKFGFVNKKGEMKIPAIYSNVGFFTEDCNLLSSSNLKVKKFGTADYASVRYNGKDFRINKDGRRVYYFKDEDLGKCPSQYKAQLFHAYVMNFAYGIIEDSKFDNPGDYRQFAIYPQYQYLHILEGDDLKNPMIVASLHDKFGIIDVNNNIIVPFIYSDIKRNFSWKLARLFEVSDDSKNYYFIDINQKKY